MRTTISIDNNLYNQIKHAAFDRKMSFSKFMEIAARSYVSKPAAKAKKYELPVFGSPTNGYAGGFTADINKTSEILQFLEQGKYV